MMEEIRIYRPHPGDPVRLTALAESNAPVRIYSPSLWQHPQSQRPEASSGAGEAVSSKD